MTYTRDDLIDICERAIVLEEHWHDRDSAKAQLDVGQAWALLKAGCDFRQLDGTKHEYLKTDERTIWIEIDYKGFNVFEMGSEKDEETFYLPTPERLEQCAGTDWY